MTGDYAAKQVGHILDQATKNGSFGTMADVVKLHECMVVLAEAAKEYDEKRKAGKEEPGHEVQN
jgi:hypothetical protein